jgi:PRTRC genetic system protein F
MKDRLTRIETHCPGLGETALYWLQRASGRTLYVLTPQSARDLCEYIHWQGSSDQADWLDEMTLDGNDRRGSWRNQFPRTGMTAISLHWVFAQAGAG